jgi:hypothetical protein
MDKSLHIRIAVWLLIGVGFLIIMSGCSHLTIKKECLPVEGSELDIFVCREIKPWD